MDTSHKLTSIPILHRNGLLLAHAAWGEGRTTFHVRLHSPIMSGKPSKALLSYTLEVAPLITDSVALVERGTEALSSNPPLFTLLHWWGRLRQANPNCKQRYGLRSRCLAASGYWILPECATTYHKHREWVCNAGKCTSCCPALVNCKAWTNRSTLLA